MYQFTSEAVSSGHPDKVADQISDAILDECLAVDPESHVACETLVTTGQVVVAGEITTKAFVDFADVARRVIKEIGYNKGEYQFDGNSCAVLSAIHEQSPDINQGVDRQDDEQGAGDQGIMFGYATNETDDMVPLALYISHVLLLELEHIRREGREMTYLRPDAKSQVTIDYTDDHHAQRINTIVISTQHDDFLPNDEAAMHARIEADIRNILLPRVMDKYPDIRQYNHNDYKLLVNPTGKFVIGGPAGDTGLTGRKIIVDTYGGYCPHGGGAFSGKDPSKVDRSAAYAARHIAKNMVAAGLADRVLIQVAYAIGKAEPVSLFVDTYGTAHVDLTDGQIAEKIGTIFDMRPAHIIDRLQLKRPIYSNTATHGHFGRNNEVVKKTFTDRRTNKTFTRDYELFTWENTSKYPAIIKEAFHIK